MVKLKARYALVYSERDLAGINIKERVLELEPTFREVSDKTYYSRDLNAYLAGFEEEILYINFLDEIFDVEDYIFLSRHSSAQKVRSLTAHFTGNVTHETVYGANPKQLSYTNPPMLKAIYRNLVRTSAEVECRNQYEVTLEVTHHGPTSLKRPLVFVEIGSDEEAWRDKKAAEAVASAVLETIRARELTCANIAVGVGGGHYARKHSRYELESEICYTHIFAKYAVKYLDRQLLLEAISKTRGGCSLALVEKKSVPSAERSRIKELLDELGVKVKYI